MKFFQNCKTLQQLRAEYKRLAKIWHPDLQGGDCATMAQINAEYDRLSAILPEQSANGEQYQPEHRDAPEVFRAAVMAVINLAGIKVELCGSWLWVTGNTKEHKEIFKAAGYRWSQNKAAWYWHEGEYRRTGKKHYTMDEIRLRHGSESVYFENQEQLTA